MTHITGFGESLLNWYEQHKRALPWRDTTDPYLIWLSEIILQQTRIDQGIDYFFRFIEKFPSIENLAAASEDEVLKLWQGLGYYSRARNLHATAKIVTEQYKGTFPSDYSSILKLKGVGEYTAAAVASISFGLPHAVVDGNVFRVIARLFGIETPIDSPAGKKQFRECAQQLLNPANPADHNQAMMEFGAIQCTPKKPNCESCIFKTNCFAFQNELVGQLPVKAAKTKTRHRYFNYLVVSDEKETILKKRTANDIWKNLYEFPLIETVARTDDTELPQQLSELLAPDTDTITSVSPWYRQILSHQQIHYRFIEISGPVKKITGDGFVRVNKKDIFNFAVPKPVERELENLNWF